VTDAKFEKIWTSAPDMDMLPNQLEIIAEDLGISVLEVPAYLRQVAKKALGGKIVSYMRGNNQMFFVSGFMKLHSRDEATEIHRLYEYPEDLLDDLTNAGGIIDVYQGVRGKSIIEVTNRKAQWVYEVYRVTPGKHEQVKRWLYNAEQAWEERPEAYVVKKLLITSEYRRNGWLSEILNTENVYGMMEVIT